MSFFCQVDILQPNETPPRCNIPSQRVMICHPIIISLPTKSKLQCEITSRDVCRQDVITRRDDIIVTRRDGISHRGGISLVTILQPSDIPPRCNIPSRRHSCNSSARMYGEARPARHVTCQYSNSSIQKFVQLMTHKEKKKVAKKKSQIWRKIS